MTQTVEVADIEKTHKNAIAELVQTACKFESHIEIERVPAGHRDCHHHFRKNENDDN